MRKNIHPLVFHNYIVLTTGGCILENTTLKNKKLFKFLELDIFNNLLWASKPIVVVGEQKTRLNKFNAKFNK